MLESLKQFRSLSSQTFASTPFVVASASSTAKHLVLERLKSELREVNIRK